MAYSSHHPPSLLVGAGGVRGDRAVHFGADVTVGGDPVTLSTLASIAPRSLVGLLGHGCTCDATRRIFLDRFMNAMPDGGPTADLAAFDKSTMVVVTPFTTNEDVARGVDSAHTA